MNKQAIQIETYEGPILQAPSLDYKVIARETLDSGPYTAVQMDLEFPTSRSIRHLFIDHELRLRTFEGISVKILWHQPKIVRLILTSVQEQRGLLDLLSLDDLIQSLSLRDKRETQESENAASSFSNQDQVLISSQSDSSSCRKWN